MRAAARNAAAGSDAVACGDADAVGDAVPAVGKPMSMNDRAAFEERGRRLKAQFDEELRPERERYLAMPVPPPMPAAHERPPCPECRRP